MTVPCKSLVDDAGCVVCQYVAHCIRVEVFHVYESRTTLEYTPDSTWPRWGGRKRLLRDCPLMPTYGRTALDRRFAEEVCPVWTSHEELRHFFFVFF